MTHAPRRRIEPLDPPPDSFDRVLVSARRRRRRTALVVASSTLALVLVATGSFALGSSLNVTQRLYEAAQGDDSGPTSGPTGQPSPTRSARQSKRAHTPRGGTQPGTAKAISWLRGRAVDANGKGIAGLYVLPGNPDNPIFTSDGRVDARTDGRGYYRIACPRAPVLLATWRIDHLNGEPTVGGPSQATFVGSWTGQPVVPSCDTGLYTTLLVAGATVTGHVVDTGPCIPNDGYDVWLWLDGDRAAANTIRIGGLRSGKTFTFSGLPPGTHLLGLRKQTKPVVVAPGATTEANLDFTCPGSMSPTPPEPTEQPSPGGSASPTPTPSPTVS